MSIRQHLRAYLLFLGFTVLLLLCYILSGYTGGIKNYPLPSSPTAPATPCNAVDRSFCTTEHTFKQDIAANDFSDILEQQTPVRVICDQMNQDATYCSGVHDNLVIQVFQIDVDSTSRLLSRNSYIDFLTTFARTYAPLQCSADIPTQTGISLRFISRDSIHTLILPFHKTDGAWKLEVPEIINR